MPRYKVLVRGENVRIRVDGQPRESAFFATRAVNAPNADTAARTVISDLQRELTDRMAVADGRTPNLVVEEAKQVPWWWRLLLPPRGFTWALWDEANREATTPEQRELAVRLRGILDSMRGLRFSEKQLPDSGNGGAFEFGIETTTLPPSDVRISLYQEAMYVIVDGAEARIECRDEFGAWADLCCAALRALVGNDLRVMLYRKAGTPRAIWFAVPEGGVWNGSGGPFRHEEHEPIVTWSHWHGGL